MVYYNENDPKAAAWLNQLIRAGVIADGIVDTQSIEDVIPSDLTQFSQCHFFAGIGGWSYALRLAGWPDDQPVWTGSCPCQPFSAAGKGDGFADERHLWPSWFWLIRQEKPSVIFGEQVEAAIRHGWLDLVQNDLEGEGYACEAVGLPAACVGSPHGRARVWFVADTRHGARGRNDRGSAPKADSDGQGADNQTTSRSSIVGHSKGRIRGLSVHQQGSSEDRLESGGSSQISELGHHHQGPQGRRSTQLRKRPDQQSLGATSPSEQLAVPYGGIPFDALVQRSGGHLQQSQNPLAGVWQDAEWIYCRDNKYRPIEPGTFPLAHGVPARVGRLRGYGNAIVPQVAAEVIKAYMQG